MKAERRRKKVEGIRFGKRWQIEGGESEVEVEGRAS